MRNMYLFLKKKLKYVLLLFNLKCLEKHSYKIIKKLHFVWHSQNF